MSNKVKTATLETGATKLAVTIDGDSQIEVTGSTGSISLTGPSGLVEEKAITASESFASEMAEMLFTLTGAGPWVIL